MKLLGLIPARGGSVRCPRKNIADLQGKTLLAWTIHAAIAAKTMIDTLVVSTDDNEIAAEALKHGVPFLRRPPELAQSDTPMMPVLRHAMEQYKDHDAIILLQPTSPFRTGDDIDNAFNIFLEASADAVVSVTEAENDFVFELGHKGRMRHASNTVVPNGAIYIISADAVHRGHNWYSGVTYAYPMPKDRSLDIDTPVDLAAARAIARGLDAAA